MGYGSRVGKVATVCLLTAGLGLSATNAFAQVRPASPTGPEVAPFNQSGCDPTILSAMGNAGAYTAQQTYTTQKALIREPTTFFGCLQGLIGTAQTMLNMFNGTGSLNIGAIFTQLAQAAFNTFMQQLANQVCSIVNNSISVSGAGNLTSISGMAASGSNPGNSVTSMMGTPATQVVPMNPNNQPYQMTLNQPYNNQPVPPSGSDDDADLNWMLDTGGLSGTAAAQTKGTQSVPASGAANSITVPDGPTLTNLTTPPPATPMSSIPAGTPDPAGAFTPAATYNAGTDPYTGVGTGRMGPNGYTSTALKYKNADGSLQVCVRSWCGATCGTIPQRNFDNGDTTGGDVKNGGIGTSGRWNIYPNAAFGERAIYSWLLFNNNFYGANHTITDVMNKWAPPSENNTQKYISQITAATGLPANTKIGAMSQSNLTAMVHEIETVEGWANTSAPSIVCKPYP